MNPILNELGRRMLFCDGAMGTLLQASGLKAGQLPELWNLERPELICDIHRQYLAVGCDILSANTFGANALKLADTGHTVDEVITAAVSLARQAIHTSGKEGYVALDIGPTGKLLAPLGDLRFEQAYDLFKEMMLPGARAGADLVLIETMGDTYEIKAAVLAAKENTDLPVFVTMIFDEKGHLLTGGDIASAVAMLEGLGVDAIGLNCGLGPVQMLPLFEQLHSLTSLPIIVNPNAGLPQVVDGQTTYDIDPSAFARAVHTIAAKGAWLVGGCCGTTPQHLAAVVAQCKELAPLPIVPKGRTVISSYTHAVSFGADPVLIGERINPTGKPKLKKALREGDMEYLLREGIAQQRSGAHVLDVNVGLPDIDEVALMPQAVRALQGVLDLPLQIDTTNLAAMESALRIYNGKALINSVNGKEESMRAIFPLVKKYGGCVIALTLDESGIPETVQGRLAIARKILAVAQSYGIGKEDIIFDALALTISADQQAAQVTLQTLDAIRRELGAYTSLGVSNISFGLPQRENINAAFFTMALQSGLNAAIINPNNAAMMKAYDAYRALAGLDDQCMDYISHYSAESPASSAPSVVQTLSLREAVLRGLQESAAQAASEMLTSTPPLEIIHDSLIPALDQVGQAFEKGTLFLPQLLMSAEAAKAAFEVIRVQLEAQGGSAQAKKEKIILATVKGDIHDIGKNIVKVLLENYGYDVIDLGKDVDPECIVAAAREQDVRLVGLSALMTTTVVNMEEAISRLHAALPKCKVMVGGAVLTQRYADMIHADFYSGDAMGAVRYAETVFGKE